MKKFALLLILLTNFGLMAMAQSKDGSAEEGQLLLADPFILEEDGWYYIYGTHSADGIVVYRSQDLKTWSDLCGNAKGGLALHKDDSWGEKWFWAPEVYKIGRKYLMTYSAEEHICYAESDSPCGPFVQREKRPYMEEKGIDSSIFWDKGKPYIFWVRFQPYGIWVAELSDDMSRVKIEGAKLVLKPEANTWEQVQAYVSEGPCVIHHEGKYYLTYSCNDYQSQDYAVGYAVSDNVTGPYVRYEGNPILHRHLGYVGTGHHSLFKRGKGYYMVYHAHNNRGKIHPRQTLIAPLVLKRDKKSQNQYVMSVSNKLIIPKVGENE